ncbi:hypothetical protein AB0K18_47945 [Nonomuraea sp. NPDC049421]|uniref:hypothetical protein n=1 Tax=Nonomuraea sp. NPDC049421 TaxID=3155275 RepID=UPI00344209BD
MTADPWLAGLSVLNLGLGVLGVSRARRWARRRAGRAGWRALVRLVPYAMPVALYVWAATAAPRG